MVYQLIILIIIPIILGIVTVSPFESIIEEEAPEEIQEPTDSDFTIFYIVLGLVWLFLLFRLLRKYMKSAIRN